MASGPEKMFGLEGVLFKIVIYIGKSRFGRRQAKFCIEGLQYRGSWVKRGFTVYSPKTEL